MRGSFVSAADVEVGLGRLCDQGAAAPTHMWESLMPVFSLPFRHDRFVQSPCLSLGSVSQMSSTPMVYSAYVHFV